MDADQRSEWENLQQKLLKAANEVVNLKITTTVGDVEMVAHESVDGVKMQPKVMNSSSLHTVVNVLQGDIETVVDQSLLSEEFNPIRELHKDREDHAHKIIRANLETLTELASMVIKFLSDNPPDESE